ncbi:MAG: Nif3-like dinuclear metal center hexameric protein [Eubacteriales bacterium]|nr:Nif3-like dinuclear metal center hexameric protein [Eubacteriales bacterium]
MKCSEIISFLEKKYPPSCAEDWDNVGLLAGSDQKSVEKIFLALDLTEDTLEQACAFGADMVITHHPMIFSGMKKINNHTFTGRRILRLIQEDISYYAMHTNYDVMGMAKESADRIQLQEQQVLSVTSEQDGREEGFGRVGNLKEVLPLGAYAECIKKWYQLSDVRVYGNLEQMVKRAAICTGSGKSFLKEAIRAGADVYVTGDIDHHTGIDAVAQGIAVIDAGHYGTEYIFAENMQKVLKEAFPGLLVKTAEVKVPYTVL